MSNNPLIRWLYSCDKVVKTSDRNVTHFMLDGGKLDLTKDYDVFQQVYSKNINEKNCIVELKTNIFKLFIDFDVLSIEEFEINKYVKVIQETIKDIYNIDTICILTNANINKKVKRDDKEYIKKGYHLHWPEILVNKEVANKIRMMIIVRFTTIFGKIPEFYENWEKIIDRTVYEHNGIRLLGADKCSISDGIKTYENRVYIIHSVYLGNEYSENLTNIYKKDTLKSIKDTSIRSSETDITKCNVLPEYVSDEEYNDENSGFDTVNKDSDINKAIQRFFVNYACGYRVEDVRKIIKIKDKEIYIIESKSKYCQNIEDYHSNNHIFFKLTPFGFCQRCRSDRDGKFGCCRDYCSRVIPISMTLRSALGWKIPKSNVKTDTKDFSIISMLEKIEGNLTGKPIFTGPSKKDKKKCK